MADRLDTPKERSSFRLPKINFESERMGRGAEGIARFSGTPQFLVYLTGFVVLWIAWNTLAPTSWQFDRADLGFTALTLMLSLQASYSAPLILLAQNRQDDRDRVQAQQDRQRAERNLTDTEYLTREIAGLRLALRDVATRDFVRSELRDMLDDLREELAGKVDDAAEQVSYAHAEGKTLAELAAEQEAASGDDAEGAPSPSAP